MGMATRTTEDVAHAVKDAAKNVGEQVRSGSEQAYVSAKAEAERMAAERRDSVAGYAHDIADAFGVASTTLHDRGRETAARLAQRAAEEIDAIGGRVEGQDVGHLFHEVEAFARRRPALFLGGAFLLSFVLVRYISRSTAEEQEFRHEALDADQAAAMSTVAAPV